MKSKFKFLFRKMPVIAFVLAVVAALAFKGENPESVYYRDANGFHEKTEPGTCQPAIYNCEYEYVGFGNPEQDNDPSHYNPVGLANRIFVPN